MYIVYIKNKNLGTIAEIEKDWKSVHKKVNSSNLSYNLPHNSIDFFKEATENGNTLIIMKCNDKSISNAQEYINDKLLEMDLKSQNLL